MSASQGKDKDVGDITADLMDVFSSPKGGKSQESFSLQKQNSNQGGEGDFAFPDDEFADYESVKVFYKLQQQWNPGNASAHDIYFSKVGHLLLSKKLDKESVNKLERIIRRGYGDIIGAQLDSLLMTEDERRMDTILQLLWRSIQQKAPEALEEGNPNSETYAGSKDEQSGDEWWKEEAEEVASPVRKTRRPSVIRVDEDVEDFADSDSDGEPAETQEPTPGKLSKGMSFRHPTVFDDNQKLQKLKKRLKESLHLQLDHADETKQARQRRASIAASAPMDQCEGVVYLRVTSSFFTKSWKPRFAVLQNGLIKVYADRMQRRNGSPPLETIAINKAQALSAMQTLAEKPGKHPRIFYRHIAEQTNGEKFPEGTFGDSNKPGQRRVFKFGCDNQNELDFWSKAIRAAIQKVTKHEEKLEQDIIDAEGVHSSTDEFQHAISATEEPHANSGFSNQISSPTANNINYVKISLLNAEQFTVPTYDNATVKDAIIALRNQLGLRADAQYSLFLKDISRGRPMFTVLPDVMSIEEAEGLALAENKSLVYKRRTFYKESDESLSSPSHSASQRVVDMNSAPQNETLKVPPIEEEERSASHPNDAAHKLAYIEAVHNTLWGHFCIDVETAILLAGLHCISHFNCSYSSEQHTHNKIKGELRELLSPTAIVEFINLNGKIRGSEGGIEALITAVRAAFAEITESLNSMLERPEELIFVAQKLFLKQVKTVLEYGANFYIADLRRIIKKDVPDIPEWILAYSVPDSSMEEGDVIPCLAAINCEGIMVRPLPPTYTPTVDFQDYNGEHETYIQGRDPVNNRESLRLMKEYNAGKVLPWFTYPLNKVQTWSVHPERPTVQFAVRDVDFAAIELESPQYKEISSMIHTYVFTLLALNQKRPLPRARIQRHEFGSLAKATRRALEDAKNEATSDLPTGWTEITDPVTGSTVFFNIHTKRIVWSKPTE